MGHCILYNKNQVRDKLFLVLIFLINSVAEKVKIWDVSSGGAYGNRFTILYYGL